VHKDGFIVNKCSGKVLDVRGGPLVDSALICQYDRKLMADANNQRWGYNNGYIYVLADRHMVLDVKNNMTADGTRVILYHRKFGYDNVNQLWDLVPAGQVRSDREVLFEADFD
jgi:hypothetical protein